MKIREIKSITRPYFGCEDIAGALGITSASARVAASRYVRQGLIVRARKNLYVLGDRWSAATPEEKFILANMAQSPSYVSLMTALGYYEVTTRVQRDFIESMALKRTKSVTTGGATFNYTRISRSLYFGFRKQGGFFIASPEKAFLDAAYLRSFGKYDFDFSSIDANRLDQGEIRRMLKKFPNKTRKWMDKNGYLSKA